MIANPKSHSPALPGNEHNPKLCCRLTAFLLLSLYTTACTLPMAMLFWIVGDGMLPSAAKSQTLPSLGQSAPPAPRRRTQQTPSRKPAPTFNRAYPIPPVGYPAPQPVRVQPSPQFNRYRLGIGDAIAVNVLRFPDLSFQAQINQEGNVITPLLGSVPLVGLTLQEAQQRIRSGLNRYVIEPQVSLSLVNQRPVQVTVTGEVIRPGYYTLGPGSQLAPALLVAGGATTQADLRSVIVRRSLVNGSILEQRVDLFTPLQNGQSLPELRLQDGDALVIPRLEVGTTQDYDRNLVSRSSVAQPSINIRVLSYANGGIGNVTLANGSTFVDVLAAIAPSPDAANLRKIALIRFDPEQGKAVTQQLDGKAALLGNVSQNVPLQNNDVIVVGRSLVSKVTYALNVFTQPFRDVLGFLLFFDSLRDSASNLFSPTRNDGTSTNR